MLDERPEGVYVNPEADLIRIERVDGDMSVTTMIVTPLEAVHLMDRLRDLC